MGGADSARALGPEQRTRQGPRPPFPSHSSRKRAMERRSPAPSPSCHHLHPLAPEAPWLPASLRCALTLEGGLAHLGSPRRLSRPPEAPHHSPSHLCSALAAHPRARPPILLLPSPCRESSGTLSPDPASSFGTGMCPSPLLGRHLLSPQRAHHTHPPSSLSGES